MLCQFWRGKGSGMVLAGIGIGIGIGRKSRQRESPERIERDEGKRKEGGRVCVAWIEA